MEGDGLECRSGGIRTRGELTNKDSQWMQMEPLFVSSPRVRGPGDARAFQPAVPTHGVLHVYMSPCEKSFVRE